jgi:hypothetical protein
VMDYVRRRRELVDGAFEITVHDVLANDEHGLVIATGRRPAVDKPSTGGRTACTGSVTTGSSSAGFSPRVSTSSIGSGASGEGGNAPALVIRYWRIDDLRTRPPHAAQWIRPLQSGDEPRVWGSNTRFPA